MKASMLVRAPGVQRAKGTARSNERQDSLGFTQRFMDAVCLRAGSV